MHALLQKIAYLLALPSLIIFSGAGYHVPTIVEFQQQAQQKVEQNTPPQTPSFGAFNPTGGGTYKLYSSIGSSNSSVTLSSFKEPVSNIPYTMTYLGSSIEYGTLSPQSTVSEFVSFSGITQNSDGTATLTGVSRGLSRTPSLVTGCTASSTLAQAHSGQSIFILSDSPCLFSQYYVLANNATSTGILTFTGSAPPRYDNVGAQASGTYIATTSEFVSWAGLAAVANAGTVNATESVKGIIELATQLEMASTTATGSTGAGVVLQAKYATSTPFTPGRYVPITNANGTLASTFISTSSVYAWSALNTYNAGILTTASSTFMGTTTIPADNLTNRALVLNTLAYKFPGSRAASSSVLTEDGNGNLSWISPVWTLLTSTTTAITLSAATTSTFSAKSNLMIVVQTQGGNGNNTNQIIFNGDYALNYGSTRFENGNINQSTGIPGIRFDSGTSSPETITFFVSNVTATRKMISWTGASNSVGISTPVLLTGSGVWNNTSNQITSVTLTGNNLANTYTAGTSIYVYGAN